jgi:hypothetical protein
VKTTVFIFALFCTALLACGQESYGTIRATTKLRPDGSSSTTIVDPEKRTAEETITDAGGKTQRKTTYLLGDRNFAVEAIFADAKGNIIYKAAYQRDGLGRVLESSFTGPDGKYLGKRLFTYGANDVVTRTEDYDAQNRLIVRPVPAGNPKRR